MTDIPDDVRGRQLDLLLTDPAKALLSAIELIRQYPRTATAYFARASAWRELGRPDLALQDVETMLTLDDRPVVRCIRGQVLRDLGRYREAIEDFAHGEAFDPHGWGHTPWALCCADCHAQLGDEDAAMAECAKLKKDWFFPPIHGLPGWNKQEVICEIQRRARAAPAAKGN
jgi:tetratricopeptide (TPR) repeat protein